MPEENFPQKEQNGVDGAFKTADEESEPCLEEKSKGRLFWTKTEQKLRDKSGLTKHGLYYVGGLALFAFLLLIVVIVLSACWPATPHRFQVCNTESCLRAATQVRQYLDESSERCNVREWACGGWLQGRELSPERSKWNRRVEVEQQEAVRIREMISTLPLPLSRGTIEWKLKYFYDACVDVDAVNADGDRPLKTIISELGGWHLLRNWNTEDFDFNGLLRTLHVTYGVSPYFKITTVPNPREPGNTSIVILPAGLGLPDKSYYYLEDEKYSKAYEQLITDVIVLLGQSTTDTQRSAKDVYSYERRLAEIMPNRDELRDPISTYNPMKVSALKLSVQQILPLQDILTAMYPDANINEETEVIVAQPDYLAKLSQLVSSTDSQTRNSYMMWTLVREYVPYLSADFQKAIDRYHSELFGVKNPIERWEFCSSLVQRFMPIAIEAVLERQQSMGDAKHVVNQMFEQIAAQLRQDLDDKMRRNDITSDLHSKLKKKLELVKLHVGLPDGVLNATFVKTFYNRLNIIRSNLFENHKKAIVFAKKREEQLLRESSTEDYLMAAITRRPAQVEYVPSGNVVVVPRVLLTAPYFESRYPKSINYARIGNDIAFALVSSILPFDSGWTADAKLLSQYHLAVNESQKVIDKPTRCLTKLIEENHYVQADFASLSALNTYKYLTALETSYNSMETSLMNKEHVHIPSLAVYEDSDLFYLTSLQELCTLSTDQQNLHDTLVNHKLPENGMCNKAGSGTYPMP
ncbi:protein gone early-like isoform X2 [Atheta coriaria]|uniref:protein gone early-like isoform X2 n=1 Tax=Dalotia coriaria TaxID=877792 RepID=UPI0031F35E55